MALAILIFQGKGEGTFRFRADLGTNVYYKYIIGKSRDLRSGQPVVDDVSFESRLFQAEPASVFDSSFNIQIPEELSTANMSYVQLISFKDSKLRSPAFSDVVQVLSVAGMRSNTATNAGHTRSADSTNMRPISSFRNVSFSYSKRAGLSAQSRSAKLAVATNISHKITIDFVQTGPITVQGKLKYVYQTTAGIKLMLKVNNIKQVNAASFQKVIVQLLVKDVTSLELLLNKKFKMKDVALSAVLALDISPEELMNLPKNQDLLISAHFESHGDTGNESVSSLGNTFIFLSDKFVLKAIGAAISEEKPLNDVIVNRAFWHKVWEGGGNNKRWELDLDTKYLCIYKYDTTTNGRMESRLKVEGAEVADEARLKIVGKLKTGLEVSPLELNKLLLSSGDYPPLSTEQLTALMTAEIEMQMNQEANVRIALKGKKDERGVLWVYPEVTIHDVILQKVLAVNENGQVSSTADEHVFFPRISSFHFIGAKTA